MEQTTTVQCSSRDRSLIGGFQCWVIHGEKWEKICVAWCVHAGISLIFRMHFNVVLWKSCLISRMAVILTGGLCISSAAVDAVVSMIIKPAAAGLVDIMMMSSNGNIFRVTGPLCGNSPVTGEFPTQRPVTRSFDIFFDLPLNKRLSKQLWDWWFETSLCSLWHHRARH